ncbi:MAG TPA: GTPase Era [Gammaproteobacteria bacterium]|nr:GTPase Era [Gammaproteobacteria bacterium]
MTESMARCGFVALVGRPNVGKSTLLNRLLGQKVSITSSRPQTTRNRILGIKSEPDYQAVYVDTPGLHLGAKRAVNRFMNREAGSALLDVDVVIFLIEALRWTEEDDNVLERLREIDTPVILAVNKVDRVKDKERLLPFLQEVSAKADFADVVPLSATKGSNTETLERLAVERLPESPPLFPEEQLTDRSERFLAAELVREKLIGHLGEELPYSLAVEIEKFDERKKDRLSISALIWVERPGQKKIVIGREGHVLKEVGRQARIDMERLFGAKVFLELWVKVKEGWADDERALRSLGYSDEM